MSITWEEKILHTCVTSGEYETTIQDIYTVMKDYGGSSTYQYEIRSRLTSIVAKGDLIRTARGVYIVSPQGHERYRILLEREGSLDA